MSDKVKLIVTLSKGQYENLKNIQCGSIGSRMIVNAVMNGIPLDENKGEWIPVSERLPEKSGEYLIAIKDRGYTEISWFYFADKKWSYRNVDIVAWAYVPEPYKEGGNIGKESEVKANEHSANLRISNNAVL